MYFMISKKFFFAWLFGNVNDSIKSAQCETCCPTLARKDKMGQSVCEVASDNCIFTICNHVAHQIQEPRLRILNYI